MDWTHPMMADYLKNGLSVWCSNEEVDGLSDDRVNRYVSLVTW
jgi:hypothetical protein